MGRGRLTAGRPSTIRLTTAGADEAKLRAARRADPNLRIDQLRRALLLWLHDEESAGRTVTSWLHFFVRPRSHFVGDLYGDRETDREIDYIKVQQNAGGISVSGSSGVIIQANSPGATQNVGSTVDTAKMTVQVDLTTAGGCLLLRIADNGVGIGEGSRRRLSARPQRRWYPCSAFVSDTSTAACTRRVSPSFASTADT
jgi:hypothetical protein